MIDRAVIRTTLAAYPHLRNNLRILVQRITLDAFAEVDLAAIERELVDSIRISEVFGMPSAIPAAGQPLNLTAGQFDIIRLTVARFRDPTLRTRLAAEISSARRAGRVQIK